MHVAVVTPTLTPYRDPFWNELARRPEIDLTVFYLTQGTADRPWDAGWQLEFDWHVPPGRPLAGAGSCYWNPSIAARLADKPYEAILLGGYNHPTMLRAIIYARRQRIPYYLMCESFLGLKRATYRRIVKRPFVRWIVKHATGILPTGTLAREYLIHYGGNPGACCFVPNSPDLDGLRRRAEELAGQRDALRRKRGWGAEPVVIYVGRLIWKKGVDVLLRAFVRPASEQNARLVIAGDGPERENLTRLAAELGLRDRVEFPGFLQPQELPEWYAAADVFTLPSLTEPWGVVVMEALAAGLPVVVSDLVGCHPDVINSEAVGSVVPAGDADALARALARHISERPDKATIDSAWEPVYQQMRHPAVAANLVELLQRTAGCRHAVPGNAEMASAGSTAR